MILFPNAKINLGLNIMSRRPDGYHEIATIMLPVGWHDVLEIVPSASGRTTLTVYGNKVDCKPEDNLVMRAYRELALVKKLPPVEIFLEKIIPDGAGLGGGSSDASFTLIGLNNMFNLGCSEKQLCEIAAKLGADCPFFIYNRPMLATGTGTTLEPIGLNVPHYILLAKPDVKVPTRDAYAQTSPAPWRTSIEKLAADKDIHLMINDFEASVFPQYPEIKNIKDFMMANGAEYAAMSGSGSTVFGLYDNEQDAITASEQLKHSNRVHICKVL